LKYTENNDVCLRGPFFAAHCMYVCIFGA